MSSEANVNPAQKVRPKAILFDFYGVLFPARFAAWVDQHAADEEQRELFFQMANQSDRGDITKQEFYAELGRLSGTSFESVDHALHHNQQPIPDMLELLRSLAGDYKIGILSNSDATIVRTLLKEYALEQFLETVVLSTEVGMIKPEPEIFAYALSKLDVLPEECLFIDDTASHVAAAERLGLKGIVFTGPDMLKALLLNS